MRRLPTKPLFLRLTKPIASFTFDDFPRSAWVNGGPILARHAARATYYVTGSYCDRELDQIEYYRRSDLLAVHSASHEVGHHTFAHRAVPTARSDHLREDLRRNTEFIRDILGDVQPTTFAYPYGEASIRTKALLAQHFACCRGTEEGLNRGWLDLAQLNVVNLREGLSIETIERWIAETCCTNAWIIFVSHDIADNPSCYGTTPEILNETLARTLTAGIDILTVKDALERVVPSRKIEADLQIARSIG